MKLSLFPPIQWSSVADFTARIYFPSIKSVTKLSAIASPDSCSEFKPASTSYVHRIEKTTTTKKELRRVKGVNANPNCWKTPDLSWIIDRIRGLVHTNPHSFFLQESAFRPHEPLNPLNHPSPSIDLFTVLSSFDLDKFGKIRRHHWKERLKISKITKFESFEDLHVGGGCMFAIQTSGKFHDFEELYFR